MITWCILSRWKLIDPSDGGIWAIGRRRLIYLGGISDVGNIEMTEDKLSFTGLIYGNGNR